MIRVEIQYTGYTLEEALEITKKASRERVKDMDRKEFTIPSFRRWEPKQPKEARPARVRFRDTDEVGIVVIRRASRSEQIELEKI